MKTAAALRTVAGILAPPRTARQLRGRVLAVRAQTTDSATLVIRPGRGFPTHYLPGQYIGVGALIDGRWRWRSYSLTSAPGGRDVSITVKAMPDGVVSDHLVRAAQPGTVLRLVAPAGDFVLTDPPPASVLFLTAGSGITPVMSMLRTMAIGDVRHLHSVPAADEMIFADELSELQRRNTGYRLTVRATRTDGRLDLRSLDDVVPDWRDRHTWVCGPESMLADAEAVWQAEGLTARLHTERFSVTRTRAGQGGRVVFARSGRSVDAGGADSLLEAGEAAGVRMPSGCRMGICHSCVVPLRSGRVRDLRNGTEHEAGALVQTCVSAAEGDCELDI